MVNALTRKARRGAERIIGRIRHANERVANVIDVRQNPPSSAHEPVRRAIGFLRREVRDGGLLVYAGSPLSYPEVTGYTIPTALQFGESRWAGRAGAYLLARQLPDGSFGDPDCNAPYAFDTGQALRGLLALARTQAEFVDPARRAADWLLRHVEPAGRLVTPTQTLWSLQNGSRIPETIHLYVAPALRDAAELLATSAHRDAAEAITDYYLERWSGRFDALSHCYGYVVEALIDMGRLDAARAGLADAERMQQDDGAVPGWPDERWICSTGLAQLSVCWSKLGQTERARRALRCLLPHQRPSGGFYGSWGPGAWYLPDREIGWAVKYFLDAWQLAEGPE
ncbi:MAG TPA: hypothetical protein VKT77_14855 [Chthonomonadaceae bacterium]|nr:hypothetical protein [Chthonomonadaceae bacterium]